MSEPVSYQELALLVATLQLEVDRLRKEVEIDPLTRLKNKRGLDRQIKLIFSNSSATKIPVAVLLIDIDHFKKFNEKHGYQKANEVLIALAEKLREYDAVRWGGEEFVVILTNITHQQALMVAERIREIVMKLDIGIEQTTVSIGVASSDSKGHDFEELFFRANIALREAKKNSQHRLWRHSDRSLAIHTTRMPTGMRVSSLVSL